MMNVWRWSVWIAEEIKEKKIDFFLENKIFFSKFKILENKNNSWIFKFIFRWNSFLNFFNKKNYGKYFNF